MKIFDLDHAATTSIDKQVTEAMLPYLFDSYGNPSSMHALGMQNKKDINTAKKHMAHLLNCDFNELIFTGSGTEATNLAIKGYALSHLDKKEIITTPIEHAATLNTCLFMEQMGYTIHYLKIDKQGFIDLNDLEEKLNQQTLMVSILWANNEIGTIQDLAKIAQIVSSKQVCLHVDAIQMVAHYPIDLSALNVDLMSFSAHKCHGPKGTGMLYKKMTTQITPLIHGGGQEFHYRSGTEAVANIIGFEKALTLQYESYSTKQSHLKSLAESFYQGIKKAIPCHLNGPESNETRLPGLLSIGFFNVSGLSLQYKLNQKGIYVSTGSACHSNEIGISHVIQAIDAPNPNGVIRISFGTDTRIEDIPYLVESFIECYLALQED